MYENDKNEIWKKKTLGRKNINNGWKEINRRKFLCTRIRQLFKAKGPSSANQDEWKTYINIHKILNSKNKEKNI